MTTADAVADLLGLEPLDPEGGLWAQSWRDEHSSAIYFLLRPGDFSAMHRLTVDELWHHYAGAPAQLLLLGSGGSVDRPVLGDDLGAGQRPLVSVPAGVWMGASTGGEWTLLGTTVAPPFRPEHFELGRRDDLVTGWPAAEEEIASLTRTGST
jgi:predicted cupin superfamily sugar epimerase